MSIMTLYNVVALTTELIEWHQKILAMEFFSLWLCKQGFKVSQNPIQVSLSLNYQVFNFL